MKSDAVTMPCELCGEPVEAMAVSCPHCKASRKPCPFCRKPFWNGADECPHCGNHKPTVETWSIMDE